MWQKPIPQDRIAQLLSPATREKFYKFVDKNGPVQYPEQGNCWTWTGPTSGGYGTFLKLGAHRVSWIMENGRDNPVLTMHSCDCRLCVRPSHLSSGTYKENTTDAAKKGRIPHSPHLTPQTIRLIDELYRSGVMDYKQLGRQFNVSTSTIGKIMTGRLWVHALNEAL